MEGSRIQLAKLPQPDDRRQLARRLKEASLPAADGGCEKNPESWPVPASYSPDPSMSTATLQAARTSRTPRPLVAPRVGLGVLWTVLGGLTLWAAGALWFDFPVRTIRQPVAVIYAAGIIAVAVLGMGRWRAMGLIAGAFIALLVWWLTLRPSNDRAWQPDVAETPWAEVDGDRVTLHNVRNCEYRTATDFTPRWETRTVDLAQLTGLDLAIDYWGSEWMAHPIASFQFADAPPVCFSIETRKEVGERYSAIGGFYRQFELVVRLCGRARCAARAHELPEGRGRLSLSDNRFTSGGAAAVHRVHRSDERVARRASMVQCRDNQLHHEHSHTARDDRTRGLGLARSAQRLCGRDALRTWGVRRRPSVPRVESARTHQ